MPAVHIMVSSVESLREFLDSKKLSLLIEARFSDYYEEEFYRNVMQSFNVKYDYVNIEPFMDDYFDIMMEHDYPEDFENFFSMLFQFKDQIDCFSGLGRKGFLEILHGPEKESIRIHGGILFRGLGIIFNDLKVSSYLVLDDHIKERHIRMLICIFNGSNGVGEAILAMSKKLD